MKIAIAYPPNIENIRKIFPNLKKVAYCYGDTIYNPDNLRLDDAMIAHEEVHEQQQIACGVKEWWDQYLLSPVFHVLQEGPAYRRQYQYAKSVYGKRLNPQYAQKLAEVFAGDTYGRCITYIDALKFITT